MPTRTLSSAVFRPSGTEGRVSRLVVVDDGGRGTVPDAVPDAVPGWVARTGWAPERHPGTGPGAAVAAALLGDRVLLLRPSVSRATTPRSSAPAVPGRVPRVVPRVVAALDRLPDDLAVVADAATCAARAGALLTLVHAVPRSFAERSVGLAGAVAHGRRLLDAAASEAAAREPAVPVECALLRMRPYELVGEALDADLLVVGGPRADRLMAAGPGPGLVAHSALHHAPCPVLLVPR